MKSRAVEDEDFMLAQEVKDMNDGLKLLSTKNKYEDSGVEGVCKDIILEAYIGLKSLIHSDEHISTNKARLSLFLLFFIL